MHQLALVSDLLAFSWLAARSTAPSFAHAAAKRNGRPAPGGALKTTGDRPLQGMVKDVHGGVSKHGEEVMPWKARGGIATLSSYT